MAILGLEKGHLSWGTSGKKHPKIGLFVPLETKLLTTIGPCLFVCFSYTKHKYFQLCPLKITWRLFVSPLLIWKDWAVTTYH